MMGQKVLKLFINSTRIVELQSSGIYKHWYLKGMNGIIIAF